MKGEQMRHFCFALTTALAVLACLVSSTPGQEVTGGFFGTVQDASGAVVPSAVIHLRNVGPGRISQTAWDESGNFSITLLPIGPYEVTAEARGFKKSAVGEVVLRV